MSATKRRLAAAASLAVLGALTARAFAEPATPTAYPAGTTGTRFSGLAFDTCDAPCLPTMQAWRSSPFGALGIYISGSHRPCAQSRLSASWVRDVTKMGWKLLPLDVGLQAPCIDHPRLRRFSTDPGTARTQGATAARHAVAAAKSLGIRPGSPIYTDIEYYAGNNAACSQAVRAYVSGWTTALHERGYLSGVYGNTSRTARDLSASYGSARFARPDAVWAATWNNSPTLTGWAGVPDTHWPNHQRVKQYRGDHTVSHGGRSLRIDANVMDGPVATVALPYALTGGQAVVARLRPHLDGDAGRTLAANSTVQVICRSPTAAGVWDKLTDGSFVPDAAVAGGSAKPELPVCATPYQVATANVNMRTGPTATAPVNGTLAGGSLAWVICETPGVTLGRQGWWQKLDTGQWISGPLLSRPSPYERAVSVPLCIT